MDLGRLILKLVLERQQFRAEMAQATAQAEQEAAKLQGATERMAGAARDALATQGAAGRATAGALQMVGPAASSAAAGVAVLAAGAVAAAVAYHQGSKEAQAYEKAIILTGNASGTTAGQMADMARNIDLVVGTQAQAAAALASLAGTGKVAGENLQKFGQLAVQMERTVGQSVDDTAKVFERLGDAPVAASLKLNDSMNYLTAATYAQIKAAEDLGDEEEAASIAQNAYATAMEDRMKRVEDSLGWVEKAWREIAHVAKEGWDAMLNIGRPDTLGQQIDNVRQKIAQAQGQDKNRPFSMPWDTPLADLQQQLANLTEQERLIRRGTEAQTERNRVAKEGMAALDEVAKANARAMSKQDQANKSLDVYRRNIEKLRLANDATPSKELAALLDPKLIADTEAAILKSGETRSRVTRQAISEQEKLAQAGERLAQSLLAQESGLSGNFAGEWDKLSAAYADNRISLEELTAAQAALLEKQPAMQSAAKAEEKVRADLAKTMAEYEKAQAGGVAEAERAAAQAERQLTTYGLLESQVQELTLTYLEQSRESAALAGEDVTNIEKRIAAQKRLIAATRGIEERKDVDESMKRLADAGQKMADSINQSLTDSLMRGFESGKDFAKNLRDTVVNMFKTMVLRPIISFILNPVSMALGGLFGGGSAMAGQAGGSSLLGMGMQGAQLYNGLTSGTGMLGTVGNWLGLGASGAVGAGAWGGAAVAGSYAAPGIGAVGSLGGVGAGGGFASAAAAVMPWLLGAAAVAALWKPLFGRTLKDSGIEGTFGESGFEGRGYKFYEGGLFRSDKTTYSALDEQVRKTLGDTYKAMREQTIAYADVLGLSTERLKGFTSSLKLSLHGLSDADAQKKIQEALATANDELAQQVLGTWSEVTETITRRIQSTAIEMEAGAEAWRDVEETVTRSAYTASEFAKEGERASDTLARLATSLSLANTWFLRLGATLFESSLGGADRASDFIDAMGGKEAFDASASAYYGSYYTTNQRRQAAQREVEEELGRAGVEMPRNAVQFREMMNAALAAGEAGQETAAALFRVAPAFAEVNGSIADMEAAMGVSAQSLKGILDDVLKSATSAGEAEKMASDRFRQSILDGMSGMLTQQISQLMMSAVVGPMMDSLILGAVGSSTVMVAGGATSGAAVAAGGAAAGQAVAAGGAAAGSAMAAGGAAAGRTVADVVADARAMMASFSAVMNDPAFQEFLSGVSAGFGEIAGDLFGASGGFQSAGTAMSYASGAAGGMADSITGLGDSIEEEIKRLRGLMVEDSPAKGKDFLLAEFTSATAAARAGDQTALARLPELSQQLEAATRLTAGSSVELARMRGWLAGSLEQTRGQFTVQTDAQRRAAMLAMNEPGYDIRDTPRYANTWDANPIYTPWEEGTVDSRYDHWFGTTPRAGTGNLRGQDPNAAPDIRYTGGGIGAEQYDARDPAYMEDWRYRDTWSADPYLRNPRPGWYGPSYEVGTPYVPKDGLAYLHQGEAVLTRAQNQARGGSGASGMAALVAEVQALRRDLAQHWSSESPDKKSMARMTRKMTSSLDRIAEGALT